MALLRQFTTWLVHTAGCRRVVEYIGAGCTDNSSDDARRKTMFLVQGESLSGCGKGANKAACILEVQYFRSAHS